MKRFLVTLLVATALEGTLTWPALASGAAPWIAEREKAVNMARAGKTQEALNILNQLYGRYPQDPKIAQDYVAVANWAGRHADATEIYSILSETTQPDYVLQAAGGSYRSLGQWEAALGVFQNGLQRYPANAVFAEGAIRCLTDLGKPAEALELARQNLKEQGDRVGILLAGAYAARAARLPTEALRYSQKAFELEPVSRAVRKDLVASVDFAGAPDIALALAAPTPDLLSAPETRRVEGNAHAAIVRVGPLDPLREPERFTHTDRAIARLDAQIAEWQAQGEHTRNDVLRIRFDRMIALRDRVRMQDVLKEYDDLKQQDIQLPVYAITAVADAYLYTRQPEKALPIYQDVLKSDPKSFNARMAVFYTLIELSRYEEAYREIDSLVHDEPKWVYLKGLKDAQPNPERSDAELTAGMARIYGNQLAEAKQRITPLAEAAPGNSHHKAALGAVYESRGLPRKAQEEYQLGKALANGTDLANEAGEARTNLALQRFHEAGEQTEELHQRFPENLQAQKLKRNWDIHNMHELNVRAERGLHSSGNSRGDGGIGVDTQYYSRPLDYHWRIMAGQYVARETQPNEEGRINYYRSSAGVEYRGHGITANLTPTYHSYKATGHAGVRTEASYSASDHWAVGGSGEIFSRATPLRALNAGVRANAATVNVTFRENESQEATLNGGYMGFSDGNRRLNLGATVSQRLYTAPTLKLDGIATAGFSSNSKDQDRLYYNPERDVSTQLGLRATHTLYRRYEFLYEHTLTLMPGYYWEKNYGSSPMLTAQYEHMLELDDVRRLSLGLRYARQDYDGETENNLSMLANFNYRFRPW